MCSFSKTFFALVVAFLASVTALQAQPTNRTPILRGFLQTDLDANGKGVTNAGSIVANNLTGNGSGLTNLSPNGITNAPWLLPNGDGSALQNVAAATASKPTLGSQPAVSVLGVDSANSFTITGITAGMVGAQPASANLTTLSANNAINLTNFPPFTNAAVYASGANYPLLSVGDNGILLANSAGVIKGGISGAGLFSGNGGALSNLNLSAGAASNAVTFYYQTGISYGTNPVVFTSATQNPSANGTYYWNSSLGWYTNSNGNGVRYYRSTTIGSWTFSTGTTDPGTFPPALYAEGSGSPDPMASLNSPNWFYDLTSDQDAAVLTAGITNPVYTTNAISEPLTDWVRTTLNAKFAAARLLSTNDIVIADGDSRTQYPNWGASTNWPNQLMTLSFWTNRTAGFLNNALNGAFSTRGFGTLTDHTKAPILTNGQFGYYIEGYGVNDLGFGSNAVQLFTVKSNLWNAAHTNGYLVLTCTIEGADTAQYPQSGSFETNRQAYNQMVRNTSLVDGVIDYDALFSVNPHDTNWYLDALHPTALGHALKAQYANSYLSGLGRRFIRSPSGMSTVFLPSFPSVPPTGYTNGVWVWNSNQVIYGVTASKTNLWHDMR